MLVDLVPDMLENMLVARYLGTWSEPRPVTCLLSKQLDVTAVQNRDPYLYPHVISFLASTSSKIPLEVRLPYNVNNRIVSFVSDLNIRLT